MAQPNPDAVKRLARYMKAKMPALLMHPNPHEALAEWMLVDVLPYGMEIIETGDIESISRLEALASRSRQLEDEVRRAEERAMAIARERDYYRDRLKRLADEVRGIDEIEDERYGAWHSPTEPN